MLVNFVAGGTDSLLPALPALLLLPSTACAFEFLCHAPAVSEVFCCVWQVLPPTGAATFCRLFGGEPPKPSTLSAFMGLLLLLLLLPLLPYFAALAARKASNTAFAAWDAGTREDVIGAAASAAGTPSSKGGAPIRLSRGTSAKLSDILQSILSDLNGRARWLGGASPKLSDRKGRVRLLGGCSDVVGGDLRHGGGTTASSI
jgi:hypothetical protein